MPDFSQRSTDEEMMDDPSISAELLKKCLGEIEFINQTLGGYGPSLRGVRELLPGEQKQYSLLDVGTGGADTPRKLCLDAIRHNLDPTITAIDLSAPTIDFAKTRCFGFRAIDLRVQDLYEIDHRDTFDIVHAALVLHHFPGEEAVRALRKMYALSRYGLVVNDLHRHPVAWASIKYLTRLLPTSQMVRYDAPLSVLRSFVRQDWFDLCAQAGLPEPIVRWRPMFRWQVLIRK